MRRNSSVKVFSPQTDDRSLEENEITHQAIKSKEFKPFETLRDKLSQNQFAETTQKFKFKKGNIIIKSRDLSPVENTLISPTYTQKRPSREIQTIERLRELFQDDKNVPDETNVLSNLQDSLILENKSQQRVYEIKEKIQNARISQNLTKRLSSTEDSLFENSAIASTSKDQGSYQVPLLKLPPINSIDNSIFQESFSPGQMRSIERGYKKEFSYKNPKLLNLGYSSSKTTQNFAMSPTFSDKFQISVGQKSIILNQSSQTQLSLNLEIKKPAQAVPLEKTSRKKAQQSFEFIQVQNKLNNLRGSISNFMPGLNLFGVNQISSSGYELKQDSILPDNNCYTPDYSDCTLIRKDNNDESKITRDPTEDYDQTGSVSIFGESTNRHSQPRFSILDDNRLQIEKIVSKRQRNMFNQNRKQSIDCKTQSLSPQKKEQNPLLASIRIKGGGGIYSPQGSNPSDIHFNFNFARYDQDQFKCIQSSTEGRIRYLQKKKNSLTQSSVKNKKSYISKREKVLSQKNKISQVKENFNLFKSQFKPIDYDIQINQDINQTSFKEYVQLMKQRIQDQYDQEFNGMSKQEMQKKIFDIELRNSIKSTKQQLQFLKKTSSIQRLSEFTSPVTTRSQKTREQKTDWLPLDLVSEKDQEEISFSNSSKLYSPKQTDSQVSLALKKEFAPKIDKIKLKLEQQFQRPTRLNKQFSIFREASKNIEKSDDKNKKLDAIHLLVGKMKHQTEFYGLAKRKEESAFFESKDANIEYMLHCQKNMIQISPIFSKVKNKSLKINEQKIGTELIKALCQGINLDNNLIQKLFLSNNNLLDQNLSIILSTLNKQKAFISFHCEKNQIGMKSIEQIERLAMRDIPVNLQELRIIQCKITQSCLDSLLKKLSQCQIRRLQISNCGFYNFSQISNIRSLVELDVSNNNMGSTKKVNLKPLLHNKCLKILKISKNRLRCNMKQLVKGNDKIQYLDLRECEISQDQIIDLFEAIQNSKSLLSIDLSGNQITDSVIEIAKSMFRYDQYTNQIKGSDIKKIVHSSKQDQILDSININNLNIPSKNFSRVEEQFLNDHNKLQLNRYLYMKELQETWHILNDKQNDWFQNMGNYTLVFWSRKFGAANRVNRDEFEKIESKIHQIENEDGVPLIAGSLTNWKYQKMMRLEEFLQLTDTKYQTAIQIMNDQGITKCEQYAQLCKEDQATYHIIEQQILNNYKQNWLKILHNNCLKFKNPNLVNIDKFASTDMLKFGKTQSFIYDKIETFAQRQTINIDKNSQIWVHVSISIPGKHHYMVKWEHEQVKLDGDDILEDTSFEQEKSYGLSIHSCILEPREQDTIDVPCRECELFKKEGSIFQDWREDTEQILNICFQHDSKYWKIPHLLNQKKDLEQVLNFLRRNYKVLKKIFISQASRSRAYPCIDWETFSKFCVSCDIIGDDLTLDQVLEEFEAANQEEEKNQHEENPATALMRYEFVEMIVRVSKLKYQNIDLIEAIQTLLDNHLFKLETSDSWQMFRTQKLWTHEINLCFQRNNFYIQRMFDGYQQGKKIIARNQKVRRFTLTKLKSKNSRMSIDDAQQFLMMDSGLNLRHDEAIYCFGMSKMTVPHEISNELDITDYEYINHNDQIENGVSSSQYMQINYEEFIEMIARVAELKYGTHFIDGPSQGDQYSLLQMIEILLDKIISHMFNCRAVFQTTSPENDQSQSDTE